LVSGKEVVVERRVNDVKVKLHRGDITELEVDAIVNAANNQLWMGSGVAGAIKRKGGQEIEDEAVSKGPIPIGEAVVTGAGRLKAKYVIHAATMGMDFATDERKVADATRNSLRRARELGLSTIAFPALGAGVGRFPLSQVAQIMIGEVKRHVSEATSLDTVIFAVYDEAAHRAFEAEL
jgi:O-acetyl-ADP-ribose deacetylase (regulator of RNase III)